ncbi:hypothetical protein Naga_100953g3 [Nannochloropsis gaditana]|uniref:Uncharacterized protein n=1 Tax=Nannochloropsis gaditana TaxID=72520 RepID=W7SZT8_9STRA|nr:hypothetical protein Naga_100953g3 [Nannochloropsis gaditana]
MVGKKKRRRNAKAPKVVCGMRFKCQWRSLCKFSRRTTGILVPHTLRSMKDIRHMLCTIIKPVPRSDEATSQEKLPEVGKKFWKRVSTVGRDCLSAYGRLFVFCKACGKMMDSV